MKTHNGQSSYRVNGRIFLAVCTLFIGLLLIEPVFRYLPGFIELINSKQVQNRDIISQYPDEPSIPRQVEPNIQSFLPLILHSDDQPKEQPSKQLIDNKSKENRFKGIDFSSNGSLITIQIKPTDNTIISAQPVEISFLPGEHCIFGDGHACMYEFLSSDLSRVIFASVHSGVGGEGENFRNFVEGTGINQGLHSTYKVTQNIESLFGSQITISQGTTALTELSLIAIARIPPEHLEAYMALPIEKTLDYAIENNLLDPEILNQDLFVFETCGWRLPDEDDRPGFSSTTYSIYLGVIQ